MTWQSSSEKSFTGNQMVKGMVKDKAGNTSISNTNSQITIDKYGMTKPTIEYQVVGTPINANGWANAPNRTPATIKADERAETWIGKVGLMNASDYIYISKDSNFCGTFDIMNCGNANWLYQGTDSWTINVGTNVGRVMQVYNALGSMTSSNFNVRNSFQPVIHLKADVTFALGGTGTESNPYVVISK